MLRTTFTDFRQHAKTYFDAIENGENVYITRYGKVIAEIRPVETNHKRKIPSWKQPGLKMIIKGASLTKTILEEREGGN